MNGLEGPPCLAEKIHTVLAKTVGSGCQTHLPVKVKKSLILKRDGAPGLSDPGLGRRMHVTRASHPRHCAVEAILERFDRKWLQWTRWSTMYTGTCPPLPLWQ